MNYDRDEAMRQQEATETMIRMREPLRSDPHPDPRDELIRELLAELKWCFMGAGNLERMAALIARVEGAKP